MESPTDGSEASDDDLIWYLSSWVLLIAICWFIYKNTRRIKSLEDLPADVYGIWLEGIVTFVGDGDGFHFYHVPFLGSTEYTREDPKIKIRLAGIDAPETGQPFSRTAQMYLSELVKDKTVKLKLLGVDQYGRLLATCFAKEYYIFEFNVNLRMIEKGFACVYKASDAIYDKMKHDYIKAEKKAKKEGLGMWQLDICESPMEYKRKTKKTPR